MTDAVRGRHDPGAGGPDANSFPQYPQEEPLSHIATQYREDRDRELTLLGLHEVALGNEPAAVRKLVYHDLDKYPPLPATHRNCEARNDLRNKLERENEIIAEERYQTIMAARTRVYAIMTKSMARTAPNLARELKTLCDLSQYGVDGGFFDGVTAYRISDERLDPMDQRTDADKQYYRVAERLQTEKPLADGCAAVEYESKASSFIVHIRPHLPQPLTDVEASDYVVKLMPPSLRESGRRIRSEMIMAGSFADTMHVICRCKQVVLEEQKRTAPVPVLVSSSDLGNFDLDRLAETAGMALSLPGAFGGRARMLAATGTSSFSVNEARY